MFYYHLSPFSNVEHAINIGKLSSKLPPTGIKKMGGLDNLSIKPPPAYSKIPAGPTRRASAGSDFSARNMPTRKIASPPTKKPPQSVSSKKMPDKIGQQIDEIQATPPKSVKDLPDGEIKNTAQKLETPNGQKQIKKDLDADPNAKNAVEKGAKDIDAEMKNPKWKDLPDSEKMARIKKYATYAGIGLAASTLLGMYIKAKVDADRINNTEYTIKSISSGESTTITVKYEPKDQFTTKDNITISNSNSDPKVDGDVTLSSTSNGMIKFEGSKLKVAGDSGTLRCSTTVGNLFGQSVENVTKAAGQAAGGAVGGALGGAATSLYDTLVPKGLRDILSKTWISSLVVCIIIILIVSSIFAMSFYKSYT